MKRPKRKNTNEVIAWNDDVERRRMEYHQKRCAESENYKRVYDNMTKMNNYLEQQASEIQKFIHGTCQLDDGLKLTEKEEKSLSPKFDVKTQADAMFEKYGFMILLGFFGKWPNILLDCEHFEEDKPFYVEYFEAEKKFNIQIII